MPATRAELRRCRGPRLPVGTAALSRETKSLQITTSSTWDPRAAVSAVAPFEAFALKAIDGWGDRAPEEWLRSGLSLACSLAAGDAQRRPRAQDRSERYSNPERAFLTCAPFPLGAEQSPCEDVRKPRYKVKVRAFTAEEVSQLAEEANELSALLIRVAASTGLRFGEARRSQVERHRPRVRIAQGARALHARRVVRSKDANSRRCIPLAREVVKQLRLHRLRPPGELVFPSRSGAPIDYHNWHARSWVPRLERTGITGTSHILRHFFVTALIQSGVNAKVAQTLAGHHSAAFALDQYADAVPQQLEEAGEKVASVLLPASGSNSGCGCYGECANSCALPDG